MLLQQTSSLASNIKTTTMELISPFLRENWAPVVAVVVVAYFLRNYFNHGLNKYPGPFLAKFTDFWRFLDVKNGRPDTTQLRLHRQHGDVVRLGPNCLSFSNPEAIKTIYGLNKGFYKARHQLSKYITL
jgi:hypothetical protein